MTTASDTKVHISLFCCQNYQDTPTSPQRNTYTQNNTVPGRSVLMRGVKSVYLISLRIPCSHNIHKEAIIIYSLQVKVMTANLEGVMCTKKCPTLTLILWDPMQARGRIGSNLMRQSQFQQILSTHTPPQNDTLAWKEIRAR